MDLVTSFTLVWIKILMTGTISRPSPVTSFTLVWIKIILVSAVMRPALVTSFTLVWIKMPSPRWSRISSSRHELHARVD